MWLVSVGKVVVSDGDGRGWRARRHAVSEREGWELTLVTNKHRMKLDLVFINHVYCKNCATQ